MPPDIKPGDTITAPIWWVRPATEIRECRVLEVLERELKVAVVKSAYLPHYIATADVVSVNGKPVRATTDA